MACVQGLFGACAMTKSRTSYRSFCFVSESEAAKMRPILATRYTVIPDGVTLKVSARKIHVEGPRGKLYKDLSHIAADIYKIEVDGETRLVVDCHFSSRKELSNLRTILSHVNNMVVGVTRGFRYKMRLVYAHFPINANAEKGGDELSIRNFLGEKVVRVIPMCDGVKVTKDTEVKDQLLFEGNNIENVSRSCALVRQSCLVTRKDIRKFLDGIYVSEKGNIVSEY